LRRASLLVTAVMLLAACEQSLGLRLLAPEDGAVVSCSSVDAGLVPFSWTPVAAAQSYTIVVYDASGAQFLTRTTTGTSIELELPCGASYSWQVAANPGGSSYWSPRRRFTLTTETFTLITPRNGEVIQCETPNVIRFTWTQVRDVERYNLVVRNSAGQLVVSEQVAPGEQAEFQLPCGDTYTWQVIAVKKSPGPPVQSAVWTFRVTPAPGAPGPQLVSPPDGSTVECLSPDNGQVNFDWTDVRNASSYTLEVYRASDGALFLSRRVTASQTTETVVCRPELALQYRWRVGAHVGSQVFWSNFATFTMTVEKPFLVSPPNGATVAACIGGGKTVLFTWTVVRNATSYRVDVYHITGNLVASQVTSDTSALVIWTDSNPCPTRYRWRVTAVKAAPNPPVTSDTWEFQAVFP
jgi:hypothetical protein